MRCRLGLIVLPAIFLVAACRPAQEAGIRWGNRTPVNPAAPAGERAVRLNVQFPDIPVPRGFSLQRDKSFSYQGSTFRFGHLRYEGVWTAFYTRLWYQEQMAASDWDILDTKVHDQYHVTLYLRKGRETCEIEIQALESVLRVDIDIRTLRNLPAENNENTSSVEEVPDESA